jgi:hypothetical protein
VIADGVPVHAVELPREAWFEIDDARHLHEGRRHFRPS